MSDSKQHDIHVDADARHSAKRQADYIFAEMSRRRFENQPVRLGGATGRTQIPIFHRLLRLLQDSSFDLADVEIYFLDSYLGNLVYAAYARQHCQVGRPGGFLARNVLVPRSCFFDREDRLVDSDYLEEILSEARGEWEERAEAGAGGNPPPEIWIHPERVTHPVLKEILDTNRRFDSALRTRGAGRIALLGLGVEPHIGFVEPGAATADTGMMLTRLSRATQRSNRADFSLVDGDGNPVSYPAARFAISQGIASILSAGVLCLAAHGPHKAQAVRRMLLEFPGPQNPAGFIRHHPRVQFFLDIAAFDTLRADELEERGFRVKRHLPSEEPIHAEL
jgi:6-phosphogluconolactonase/glucosamine-6-phosphate isomerase/deaminase